MRMHAYAYQQMHDKSTTKKSPTGSLPPAMPLAITRTFRPWTHTYDDSYIYQLSLVVATATVSLIHPPQKTVCSSVCSTNVGFSVGYPINLSVSVAYVSCTTYVCTWYQPAEITSCEKHNMVLCIYINPTHGPRAWSLDDRWRL